MDYTGRIVKWCTILGAFDIKYMPRTFVKGQVLTDLVAEFAELPEEIGVYKQNLNSSTYRISLEVKILMQIPWLP